MLGEYLSEEELQQREDMGMKRCYIFGLTPETHGGIWAGIDARFMGNVTRCGFRYCSILHTRPSAPSLLDGLQHSIAAAR